MMRATSLQCVAIALFVAGCGNDAANPATDGAAAGSNVTGSAGSTAGTTGTGATTSGSGGATGTGTAGTSTTAAGSSATGMGTSGGGASTGSGGASTGSGGAGTGTSTGSGGASGGEGGAAGASGASISQADAGNAVVVSACTTNELSKCTGTNPMECHFGGDPGNYEVTVELGGSGAGETYVDAEAVRRMLPQTKTPAGQTSRFSFVTNVRVYEGEPVRPDDDPNDEYTAGRAGLDVYFRGPTPKVTSICQRPAAARPIMLWIAGDSTVCDAIDPDYAGWGQHVPQHFLSPISVANYADSGESSGTVLKSPRMWGAIKGGMKAGDWVFIQVGHNDKNTTADAFRSNLTQMLSDAKAASVNAVLITPTSRVGYALADEHVNSAGANLPKIIRDLGTSQNVPVIDLTVTTWNWLQTVDWKLYYALGTDHTHTNHAGAEVISGFIRDAVRKQLPELAKHLR